MSCKNIKTYFHPYNKLSQFSELENEFNEVWGIIEKEVLNGLNNGWVADKKGNKALVSKNFQCSNYLFYLAYYGMTIKHYKETDFPTKKRLEDKFKMKCVEKNLVCLSTKCGIDFTSIWKKIKDKFGLYDSKIITGEECCVGIGEAIINDPDDCLAFIIGDCEDQKPSLGDFKDDDFNLDFN